LHSFKWKTQTQNYPYLALLGLAQIEQLGTPRVCYGSHCE
jgi:hypothetical protein